MSNKILTKDEMKALAIGYMKKLNIYKPYINEFDKKGVRTMFEHYGGFWTWQYPELEDKINKFEEENGAIVYAVTHEYTEFGECYDFLCVSKYAEDKDFNIEEGIEKNTFNVFAWVWNKTDEWCSEYGTIGVYSFGGGIKRIY